MSLGSDFSFARRACHVETTDGAKVHTNAAVNDNNVVYGIEGKDFTAGSRLSPEVESAVPVVVEQVMQEVQQRTEEVRKF